MKRLSPISSWFFHWVSRVKDFSYGLFKLLYEFFDINLCFWREISAWIHCDMHNFKAFFTVEIMYGFTWVLMAILRILTSCVNYWVEFSFFTILWIFLIYNIVLNGKCTYEQLLILHHWVVSDMGNQWFSFHIFCTYLGSFYFGDF